MYHSNVNSHADERKLQIKYAKLTPDSRVNFQPQFTLSTSLPTLHFLQSQKKSWMSRKTKKWFFCLFFIISFGLIGLYILYYCSSTEGICIISRRYVEDYKYKPTIELISKTILHSSRNGNLPSFDDIIGKDFIFDIEGHDVIVFLHMQKTGGTSFGRHLVKDLELERECVCHRKVKKRCTCLRPGRNHLETWLFSRYSTGWKCGLHADWTELTSCVDDVMDEIDRNVVRRRYFYITYLRQPTHRYLSEFRHVRRGATWKKARLYCDGHPATSEQVPPCYSGEDWSDVDLKDFVSCESNLANNRQTRMLADLTLVDCYNTSKMPAKERHAIMLASAKQNLANLAFFGLTEYQEISQYIFEETFNLKFTVRFDQYNVTMADKVEENIRPQLKKRLLEVNNLDIKLYEFAEALLMSRFHMLKSVDTHFSEHFKNMGHVQVSSEDLEMQVSSEDLEKQ